MFEYIKEIIPSIETSPVILALFLILIIWSYSWKLLALWKSARKGSSIWFIILALINTVGILEILYIFIFSKVNYKTKKNKSYSKRKKRK